MSFTLELTHEQAALRDKAHAFAREVIRPVAAEYDRAREFPLAGCRGCRPAGSLRLGAIRATFG